MKNFALNFFKKNRASLILAALLLGPAECALGAGSTGQLYVPWNLLTTQLENIFNQRAQTGPTSEPPQTVTVAGLQWQLSTSQITTHSTGEQLSLDATQFSAQVPTFSASILLQKLMIDQTIDRTVDGILVHVHVQATCGPIQVTQSQASFAAQIALSWSRGNPSAAVTSADVSWPKGSWQVGSFACQGPTGLDKVLHDQIQSALIDPAAFQQILTTFLAQKIQTSLIAALEGIRKPLTLRLPSSSLVAQIGALQPTASGVIAAVAFGSSSEAPRPVPSGAILASLPAHQPTLLADQGLLQQVVNSELAHSSADFKLDLQSVTSFRHLMKSRLEQFFVWPDLMNYPTATPFYLRLHNPGTLSLQAQADHTLTARFPMQTIVQSWRDQTWWTFLRAQGDVTANMTLLVTPGQMTYATSLTNPEVAIQTGDIYQQRYDPGAPPTDLLKSAITGPVAALSGTVLWPDLNLGLGGTFRLQQMKWLSQSQFALTWQSL